MEMLRKLKKAARALTMTTIPEFCVYQTVDSRMPEFCVYQTVDSRTKDSYLEIHALDLVHVLFS
ncbi:hypothetical protein SAY86_031022 [Trapa natans]|uniref:Uncharacterized protein n=1 Tax=Trapa natans TaxID=22666 RepID=A0AAN7MPA4_TRANT|nr:hypothetical protein SAY86_031022 [Trapa natans]